MAYPCSAGKRDMLCNICRTHAGSICRFFYMNSVLMNFRTAAKGKSPKRQFCVFMSYLFYLSPTPEQWEIIRRRKRTAPRESNPSEDFSELPPLRDPFSGAVAGQEYHCTCPVSSPPLGALPVFSVDISRSFLLRSLSVPLHRLSGSGMYLMSAYEVFRC